MEEKDLEHINEIDMECNCCDDDDSFGDIIVNKPTKSFSRDDDIDESEARPLKSKTGIMLDLSDDDLVDSNLVTEEKPMRTISADIDEKGNLNFEGLSAQPHSGYNEIDMETDVIPDEDDDCYITLPEDIKRSGNKGSLKDLFDEDEEEIIEDKELIDEDMIEEKVPTTQGQVEADYWKKLQSKHAKTNKKGAYNTHFHLAGNPEKEKELFNHDMNAPAKPVDGKLAGDKGVGSFAADGGSITGFSGGGEGGGEGGGCCEEKKPEENNYNKLFEELLDITGFELTDNNGQKCLKDKCKMCPDANVNNADECFIVLMPYIEDSFICPLQVHTGEDFDNCVDWCDWYNDENAKKFPGCKSDIQFCDLIANHSDDIKW